MHFRYLIFFASYCFFQSALAQNYQQCQNLQGQSYAYCMDAVSKGQSPLAPPAPAGNPPQRVNPPSVVTAPSQQTPPQVRTSPPAVAPPQLNAPVVNYGQPPVVAPPSRNTNTQPIVATPINNQSVVRPPQVSTPVQQFNCQTSSGVFTITGSAEYANAKCNELAAKNTQSSQPAEKLYTCGNTSKQVRAVSSEAAYALCNPGIPPTINAPTQNTQMSFRCSGNAVNQVVQAESVEKATALCSQLARGEQPTVSPPQVNSPYTLPGAPPVANAPLQQFICQTAITRHIVPAVSANEATSKCNLLIAQDARPTVAPPTNQPVASTQTAPRVEQPVTTNEVQPAPKPYVVPTADPYTGRVTWSQPTASQTPALSANAIANLKPVFKYDCYEFQGQGVLGRPYKDIEKKFIADCAEGIASNLLALQKTDEEIKQRLYAANIVFQTDMVALGLVASYLTMGRALPATVGLTDALILRNGLTEISSGLYRPIAGAGRTTPIHDVVRLINTYGGEVANWQKIVSTNWYKDALGNEKQIHAYLNILSRKIVEAKLVNK